MKNPVLILCDQMIEDSEKRCSWVFEAAEQIRAMRRADAALPPLRAEPVPRLGAAARLTLSQFNQGEVN